MKFSRLMGIILISISLWGPMACSDCPAVWAGAWRMWDLAPSVPEKLFDNTTLTLEQDGCRVRGTFGAGGIFDGNSSEYSSLIDIYSGESCPLSGNWSVPADKYQNLPATATGDGKRIYGTLSVIQSRADPSTIGGEYSAPGIPGRSCGGSRISSTSVPELSISTLDTDLRPLAVSISLKDNGRPVVNAKLKVHAFNLPGNDKKLADYFLVSTCSNCFWGTKGDIPLATVCSGIVAPSAPQEGLLTPDTGGSLFEPSCPLKQSPFEVVTDGKGEASLEFFLDLAQLGDEAPTKDKPISIPIRVEYWGQDGKVKTAEKETALNLGHVGVVEGITYVAPPELDPITGNTIIDQATGKPKEQKTGNLADYSGDPGTSTGLKGSDRVRIFEEALLPEGVATGRPLKVGEKLYIGDKIFVNSENLKATRGNMVMSGGLFVRMRFFDSFVGKVGVGGNVPRHTVIIGTNPEKTGFSSSWVSSFIHWGSMIGSEIDSRTNPKSYMIKAGIKQIAPELLPINTVYSKGKKIKEAIELLYEMKPVYISVESAIAVDYDEQGQMLVTTRQGNATVYTEATDKDGFAVPAGKSAVIPADMKPILKDTNASTAQDADDFLSDIEDPFASSPVLAGSGASGSGDSGSSVSGNATAGNATSGTDGAGGTSTPGISDQGTSSGGVLTPAENNQVGDAAEVVLGSAISQSINPAGASNFYSFYVDSSGIVKLQLVDVPEDMRSDMSIYDRNFGSIAYKAASNPGDSLTLEKDLLGPGRFYIEVRNPEGKAFDKPYLLKTSFRPAPDQYEPNPNYYRAADVRSGQTLSAYICPVNDEDFYMVYVDSPGIFKLRLKSVPEDMRSDISLIDKGFSGSLAYSGASNPGDSVSLEKDVAGPGWYFIKVRDTDGKAHADPYSLEVGFQPAPDQYDPNQNFFRAAEVAPGQSITAYTCPSGEEDFYRFQVGAPGLVKVSLDPVPDDMKSEVSLWDKTWTQVAYSTALNPGDKVRLEKDVQGPGVYYIKVRETTGKALSEPYTLSLSM